MKFRVQIECSRCTATAETWVEGTRQYTSGELYRIKTDLWGIRETDAEIPTGWSKLWDPRYHEHSFVCPRCA